MGCLHACLLACMQAGFRGWCRAVCGLLPGGVSGALRVVCVPRPLLGLLPRCSRASFLFRCCGVCVCRGLSRAPAAPGVPPRWWPACRGACLLACMHAGFWGCPPRACGGRVRRCAGLVLWGAPWGAARPFLACSGAVLGRFWGWCGPGCLRGAGWRPVGEGAGGSLGPCAGSAGPWGPGEGL